MSLTAIANGVIVADNDAFIRGIVRAILVRAEQQVFPACDGFEAVMLAREFRARLVLLDIEMPRLNGLVACELIRAIPGNANVPIVMLTGHTDEATRLAAQRIGACALITKPFRPNVLLTQLAAYLDVPAAILDALGAGGGDQARREQSWVDRNDCGITSRGLSDHAAAGDQKRGAASKAVRPYEALHAQVWTPPRDPGSRQDYPQLTAGREVMRIFRKAERNN